MKSGARGGLPEFKMHLAGEDQARGKGMTWCFVWAAAGEKLCVNGAQREHFWRHSRAAETERFTCRVSLSIHSKARAAIRLRTKRLFRAKLEEFFQVSPSLYDRWKVTLNREPFSVSWRQMLALTAP